MSTLAKIKRGSLLMADCCTRSMEKNVQPTHLLLLRVGELVGDFVAASAGGGNLRSLRRHDVEGVWNLLFQRREHNVGCKREGKY